MIEQILSMIVTCIRAVNEWFITILNSTGTVSIVIGFISITLAARFILGPIVSGTFFRAASDRVSKEVDAHSPKPTKSKSFYKKKG